MTRITDFGRKRTYVEAGFHDEQPAAGTSTPPSTETPAHPEESTIAGAGVPPKKKRKRTKKSKRDGAKVNPDQGQKENTGGNAEKEGVLSTDANEESGPKRKKKKAAGKFGRDKRIKEKTLRTELRRQKRISEREADTICFACREKGHAARNCPQAGTLSDKNNTAVGICYRCGSKKHSLSRCKKPADPHDPLPFASCFVCSGKGHLASSCPQNVAKGIYPNGGCCKLCGETTHLAKNCGLRQDEGGSSLSTVLGTGREAGADEDDFHTIKRRRVEIDHDEKREEKVKRGMNIKAGVHTGTVKSFGKPPVQSTKKVVFF